MTSCGIGECGAEGLISCVNGETQPDNCSPADPTAEICDGLDNNCDGTRDDEVGGIDGGVCQGFLLGTDGNFGNVIAVNTFSGDGMVSNALGSTHPSLAVDTATGLIYVGGGGGFPLIQVIEPISGEVLASMDTGLGLAGVSGLDFNDVTGVLYAAVNLAGNGMSGADHLATIDLETGLATVIGPFGNCDEIPPPIPADGTGFCTIEGIEGIAFAPDGTLYGAHSARGAAGAQGIYTIDPVTGAATFFTDLFLSDSSESLSGGLVSLEFACDGTMYGGSARAQNQASDGGFLVRVDLEAGEFEFVGSMSATQAGNPQFAPSLGGLGFNTLCPETCVPDLACDTGNAGVCATGITTCPNPFGDAICEQTVFPSAEVCDGFDNDCDDSIDENLDQPTMCGVGECLEVGVIACVAGELLPDSCIPGDPSDEICDGLDNDCDLELDEGLEIATFCGVGECGATGSIICEGGEILPDTCLPGSPSAEVCDLLDNNCDGSTDENLDVATSCGVGECGSTGVIACVEGELQGDTCVAGDPTAEVCDGLDNDCDEDFDENLDVATTCGVGECGSTGVIACVEGELQGDTCVAGDPSAEVCDLLDNNCDGSTTRISTS